MPFYFRIGRAACNDLPPITVITIIMVFMFMTPVPVGAPLLLVGTLPLYVGVMLAGPVFTPVALLPGVPVVIILVLLVVVRWSLSSRS